MTEALTPEIIYYGTIAIAILAGLVIGWFVRSGMCSKHVAALDVRLQEEKKQLLVKDHIIQKREHSLRNLTGELAQTRGEAKLYESRWQTQLKKARQLQSHKVWVQNLQRKLAQEQLRYTQNRKYAEAMAEKYAITQDNLKRVHNRLTAVSKRNEDFLQWIHVFQTRLKKRNIEYTQLRVYADRMTEKYRDAHENLSRTHHRLTQIGLAEQKWKDWSQVFQSKLKKRNLEYKQLRSYASNIAQSLKENSSNLARVHTRLSEVDGKQQPLRSWIRVFQAKLKQRRTDYEQLRRYANEIRNELATTKQNLQRVHNRLTVVEREAEYMHKQVGGVVVAEVPREAEVPDTKTLRLIDKIRLFGTSKNDLLGRFSNQVRESRIESAQKERVLVNSCEEKDAIIADLKTEIRRLENRTQKSGNEMLADEMARIQQLESEIRHLQGELERIPALDNLIREHELTIDAYRYKLKGLSANDDSAKKKVTSTDKPASSKASIKAKAISKSAQEADDLKVISGIGPKLEKILNEHGLYTFAQVAALTEKDIEVLSSKLGGFKDRIHRDDWIGKARKLYKKKYGKNL